MLSTFIKLTNVILCWDCLTKTMQAKQPLKIVVLDDDLIKPDVVGGIIVDLSSTSLMSDPRKPIKLRLPIYAPGPKGDVPEVSFWE